MTKLPGMTDILDSLQRTKDTIPGHYDTLFGERVVGSKWGFELTPDHLYGQWRLAEAGPIRIYTQETENEFTLGVQPLSITDKTDICIEDGSHGPELVMNVGSIPAEDLPKTNIMTLIIGPEEDIDVVFTIHPGEATPPHGCITVEELQEKLNKDELDPNTSVKFV